MAKSISDLIEIFGISRPTLIKALDKYQSELRPYFRNGRRNSKALTKTGVKKLAELLGKPVEVAAGADPVIPSVETIDFSSYELPDGSEPMALYDLTVAVLTLKQEVENLKAEVALLRRDKRRAIKEEKSRQRRRQKAFQEFFPWMFQE
ncbi:MAG: hypothetical protein CVV64_07610 [Candidatus Wallbacteria bacterium HGW-Wallbacteria-1]|jgi:hypothetical protein|uniref:Uncharacterized protein n=1 Tax=Candidatus Wallbacteria bacterium HGW-Wallbacteria-1 TaxID=2013854 RepID=A0A2N1PQV9_9BACT|nr:MAG: hypothetical protein CVV64_07610 [Candidatus Wallbacteria bacterium HGW-Wallbacteria-1]